MRTELTPAEAAMLDWFNQAIKDADSPKERGWLEDGRRLFVATLRNLVVMA